LILHHPFDAPTFAAQQRSLDVDTTILPGPLLTPLAEAGCLPAKPGLRSVLGVWRAPERLARAPVWRDRTIDLIDIQVFGEVGLIAARRDPGGRPASIPFGAISLPRGAKGGTIVGEVRPTANGTVAMRGPMVPRCPFPPGVERTTLPQVKVAPSGFVDTGYPCSSDRDNGPLIVSAPPAGMVGVGGYRFLARDLQDTVGRADGASTVAALPDALSGFRLAGSTPDRDRAQQALSRRGANALLVGAFRPRRTGAPAAVDTR
jgi:hypothetical protein